MNNPPPFKTGDKVRLKNGKSAIQVLEVDYYTCKCRKTSPRGEFPYPEEGWYLRSVYYSSLGYIDDRRNKWRSADDFIHYDSKEETYMTLYQTKESIPRFGTMLTKNSKGEIVLEMKGKDGLVQAFDAKHVEEVMPYTVSIKRFVGGTDKDGDIRFYETTFGSVNLGDVLVQLSNGSMWEVNAVDTKTRSAHTTKNGFFRLSGDRVILGS